MPFNGSDLVEHPWNTTFSPYTDLFTDLVDNGQVFFLFPLIVITVALYVKTQDSALTSLFMIASGALLASGSIFAGAETLGLVFIVFSAMGIVALFVSFFWGR